jgi:hypothetical protein
MPSDSAIKVDRSLEEKLKTASHEEIKEIMRQASLDQNLVREDWNPEFLIPVEQTAPRGYAKTIIVNGVKTILEGATEQELLAKENAFMRQTFEHAAPTQQTQQPRNERGQFIAAEPIVSDEQKAALSLQFQLGQIDVSTYLEQSGAVAEYMEKAGVPIEELRAQIQEKQEAHYEQSWAQATSEFLAGAGNWWPGGDINMEKIGTTLIEMGAEDSPCVENLRRAAEYLRDNGQLVETAETKAHNQAVEAERIINSTTDPYRLREMLQPGHGLWGR